MIRVLLVPSSDYLAHPFPQRQNQIFERLHDGNNFEVHVVRFKFFDNHKLKTKLIIHELEGKRINCIASYYLINAVNHALEIRRVVKQEGIDAIVLSNLGAPFVYALMDKISNTNVPVMFDLPDYYPTSAAGYISDVRKISGRLLAGALNSVLRYIMRRSSLVTVASCALVEYAKQAGVRNVVHIPNGISECFLRLHDGKALREKFGHGPEDLVIGYIGSVEFWLDMRSLIKGVSLAKKRGLPLKLLIVGGKLHTRYSEKVKNWIMQESLDEHTIWLDFVPHEKVPEYMAEIDVGTIPFDVLNPTAHYAAPNKMWEYLSQMKPVISTPIPEALSYSGCVLTALTPEDYANKLSLIGQGDDEIHQRVDRGYSNALDRTWRKSTECFASTLHAMLDHL